MTTIIRPWSGAATQMDACNCPTSCLSFPETPSTLQVKDLRLLPCRRLPPSFSRSMVTAPGRHSAFRIVLGVVGPQDRGV